MSGATLPGVVDGWGPIAANLGEIVFTLISIALIGYLLHTMLRPEAY